MTLTTLRQVLTLPLRSKNLGGPTVGGELELKKHKQVCWLVDLQVPKMVETLR